MSIVITSGKCKAAVHDLGDTSPLRWVHHTINVLHRSVLHTTTYIPMCRIQNILSGLTQNRCCKNGLSILLHFLWNIASKLVAHTILMPAFGAQSVVNTVMVQLPLFLSTCVSLRVHIVTDWRVNIVRREGEVEQTKLLGTLPVAFNL